MAVLLDFDEELRRAIAHFESRFGERDDRFQLLPVGFHQKPFAQTLVSEAHRTVAVRLTEEAMNDILRLKYQLWHEAVHCLAPNEHMRTIWFEEGLAVSGALEAPTLNRKFRKACKKDIVKTSWYKPWQAFCGLNASDDQIRALHERAPDRNFDNANPALIRDIFGASEELCSLVCRRMDDARLT